MKESGQHVLGCVRLHPPSRIAAPLPFTGRSHITPTPLTPSAGGWHLAQRHWQGWAQPRGGTGTRLPTSSMFPYPRNPAGTFHPFAGAPPAPLQSLRVELRAASVAARLEPDANEELAWGLESTLPEGHPRHTRTVSLSNTATCPLIFGLDVLGEGFALASATPSVSRRAGGRATAQLRTLTTPPPCFDAPTSVFVFSRDFRISGLF